MAHILLKNKRYAVEKLPSEPRLLIELLDLCHNDSANFEMFSNAIKKDLALTAKILQVANSPAYRQWNRISDIRRMLIVLGLSNVRNIVTTCAIQQFFSSFSKDLNKNVQYIWLRSLLCANLAQRLARLVGYDKPGEVFIAGLLHQVGMLLMLVNREQEYLPILDRYYADTANFLTLEQNLMQVTHCELGAALVESWKLDTFVADAIEFQHAPAGELVNAPPLLKIIAIAAPLSARNNAHNNPELLARAGELLDLTEETTLECIRLAVEKSKKMITDLGFSGRFYMEDEEDQIFDEALAEKNHTLLGQQVRDAALANVISREERSEFIALARDLRINFATLFNLDRLIFFRIDQDRSLLLPINELGNRQLEEIQCSLADQRSLMASVLRSGAGCFSFENHCSVIDKQVIRLLAAEDAYFLPVGSRDIPLGLIVLGLRPSDVEPLRERLPLLQLLSRSIAAAYQAIPSQAADDLGISMLEFRKIAHEVSNPLTIVRNYLYILGKKLEENHPAQEDLKYINDEIERAGNILLRARENTKSEKTKKDQLNINLLIKELDHLFANSLFKTHQTVSALNLDERIPLLYCSQTKLKQVLINIIKNAVEAMPQEGRLDISTRDNCYQNGRQFVEISVQDNGPGIPPEILQNLFTPVASTKPGHSGLGLAIVSSLIDELGGHISCYSRQDEGTEFKLLIPRNLEQNNPEPD